MSLKRISLPFVALAMLGLLTLTASADNVSNNGDFELGDFTGWEVYTTDTGTHSGATVAQFDVDGDGVASNAALMSVGQDQDSLDDGGCGADTACRNANMDIFEGGGIRQAFQVAENGSTVDISANIAVENRWIVDWTGGLFELILDDVVVDSVLVAEIASSGLVRDSLSTNTVLDAGSHTVAIQVTRPWGTLGLNSTSPRQYIDDVVVDVVAPEPTPTPEPEPVEPVGDGVTKSEVLSNLGANGQGIFNAPGLQESFSTDKRGGLHKLVLKMLILLARLQAEA